jgi:UDP-GlcNAc:undecaprenyl-phosphate GlcNAc-1-phosphate transferase
MGDAGALFLGLLIASLAVRFDPNPINQFASFSVPFFLLAVPIMDTSVVVLKRLARGISPFKGGRDHLSHRLTRVGMSKRQAVVSLWLLTIFFGSLATAISLANFQTEAVISAVGISIWLLILIAFLRTRDF